MKIAVLDDYLGYSDRYADWGALGNGVAVFRDPIPAESLAETLARREPTWHPTLSRVRGSQCAFERNAA